MNWMSYRVCRFAMVSVDLAVMVTLYPTFAHGDNFDCITAKSGNIHCAIHLSGDAHKRCKHSPIKRNYHMEPESQDYKGHHIELRARASDLRTFEAELEREPELELIIDDKPIKYGQLPDGSYALQEYAYDWHNNLIDLAKKFVDYQETSEKIKRETNIGEEQ